MLRYLWLIPLLPFLGFVLNGLLGARFLPRRAVAVFACGAVLLSFLLSAGAVVDLADVGERAASRGLVVEAEPRHVTQTLYTWMPMGEGADGTAFTVAWSYALDPLAAVMILVVTGVGFLIHVYSIGYMGHEPQATFARFFAYLNLFMAMMLTLVLGASLPVVFVGWEGVGLCSYLLIGFHYERMFDERSRMSCADAGRKAFIVNRIGDMGFMLGMLLLFAEAGTLQITGIVGRAGALGTGVCTAAGLLLFLGACGKSAQIPLFVWLPDAMAGPTPVSALIHAATMVTAGVYVVCRMAPVYLAAPQAMALVAAVGAVTALFAAVIATAQDDIKKVLAYSTVSQLGYMMLAAGVGAFTAGIFHLTTHAFFKALLFLGAGSVIHALSGEQDMKKMGGLRRRLPLTHASFAVAVLAIAGIPPLSGFFSKDEILFAALAGPGGSPILWGIGVATAGLTAFYMSRLYLLVFAGAVRTGEEAGRHVHESPPVMTGPLLVLAAGSALVGFLGVPHVLGGQALPNLIARYLAPALEAEAHGAGGPLNEWTAMAAALLATAAGFAVAWARHRRVAEKAAAPRRADAPVAPGRHAAGATLVEVVRGKFYVDEAIEAVILRPYRALCRWAAAFDERIVDGLVNAFGAATDLASQVMRLAQTGYVRNYALIFFLGTVAILLYVLR
jgi:NADH-quinone oxidoreductase subunit L